MLLYSLERHGIVVEWRGRERMGAYREKLYKADIEGSRRTESVGAESLWPVIARHKWGSLSQLIARLSIVDRTLCHTGSSCSLGS
jgi:hypothetical protein